MPILVALAFVILAEAWGRHAARPVAAPASRAEPYVGGNPAPIAQRPAFHLMHLALVYTVLHVAALVLATAAGASPWIVLTYVSAASLALFALVSP